MIVSTLVTTDAKTLIEVPSDSFYVLNFLSAQNIGSSSATLTIMLNDLNTGNQGYIIQNYTMWAGSNLIILSGSKLYLEPNTQVVVYSNKDEYISVTASYLKLPKVDFLG